MPMNKDDTSSNVFTKLHFDFDNLPQLSSPRQQLNLHAVGIGLIQLPDDEGYTFTHSHAEQEEVYIVVSGQGEILIDGELVQIERGDLVRVSPQARRALKAAKQTALFVICVGGVHQAFRKILIPAT
ncbi:cupin domain-containing protein [Dendronalium sp. ChiSLP03b]|uniref:cupin domain-containing protein n=1 Tax=Dendronalium sp. ChiSLP03b TaxID=3075381 RepID=UPI002AD461B5|nr:cupin domain-containing protein [Dendronalium sp. ChiSLP03b]MDZ8205882.1 cupin domain-containing protein [Dendronalium sp. ChiSLP03b]